MASVVLCFVRRLLRLSEHFGVKLALYRPGIRCWNFVQQHAEKCLLYLLNVFCFVSCNVCQDFPVFRHQVGIAEAMIQTDDFPTPAFSDLCPDV